MKCNRAHLLALALAAAAPLSADEVLGAPTLAHPAVSPNIVVRPPHDAPPAATAQPPGPAPAIRVVPREDEDRPGRWLQIDFAALTLRLDGAQLDDWHRALPPTRYALEWTNRWVPDVRFGVADIARTQLPSLQPGAWSSYLAQLRREFGPRLHIAVDDDSETRPDAVRVLGFRTRVLRYDVLPQEPEESPQRVVQVYIASAKGVLVFACEGLPRRVVEITPTFEALVIGAELAP